MVEILGADAGLTQHVLNGPSRETGLILDPAESLLLGSGDQLPIVDQAGRGATVVRINTEYVHEPLVCPFVRGRQSDRAVPSPRAGHRHRSDTRSPAGHEKSNPRSRPESRAG